LAASPHKIKYKSPGDKIKIGRTPTENQGIGGKIEGKRGDVIK